MVKSVSRPTVGDAGRSGVSVMDPESEVGNAGVEPVSELTSYLSNLGLGDDHLARVVSLLQATQGDVETPATAEKSESHPEIEQETVVGEEQLTSTAPAATEKTVKLLLAEEQQILREAYKSFIGAHESLEVLGCSSDTSVEWLIESATSLQTNVVLMGVKALRPATVEKLEEFRAACPNVGLVLLFAFYDAQGIKALREFSRDASVGRAYLLKHTIDTADQLIQVICSVAEGRVIVDPTVMEELIKTGDSQNGMLDELSPRAREVLSWMARGYRNETIAGVLSRDVKTVERHIANIYATLLGSDDDAKHPRVKAALMYLKATGVLSTEQLMED